MASKPFGVFNVLAMEVKDVGSVINETRKDSYS
eukprot:CAMPEP_0184422062 /NCGR_PEP_ID=MMETSP0738-20130409/71909_1 /TAXON_ID=385413 /ORGANISM="Thalassiosira miniscula, Strain CCMP1093" /LENGTH=32 /DNA_ID= /DNA_START= /DNA_END= /DNA_ORIENTATION=